MAWGLILLSSPIVPSWVRSCSGCGTDDCGRTSAPSRPSTMPSPNSTRPSGSTGRQSSAFVREDSGTASGSALLVDHRCLLDAWRSSRHASRRKIRPCPYSSARSSRRKKVTRDHQFFPRWPAQSPDRLQLFSAPTPNGVKVGIMLEETSLAYEPHRIDIMEDESHDPALLALHPNGKIPAIYDPDGPSGTPLALFESGAILLYLADKTGQFISADPNTRYETIQWLMWQMGGVGPMFGQVGFFNKFAGKAYEDKRPRDRYAAESARLLSVLDERLAGREWVMGTDYSIADISLLGWVRNLIGFYEARELVGFDRFLQVQAWLNRGLARPAVQRGLKVTAV